MSDRCRDIKSLIGAFADGELDQARTERVRSHLAGCAECRRELERVEELHRLVKTVEHPKLADDYWDWQRTRVWHGIRHDRRELARPRRQPFLLGRYAGVAAGLVVVLVVVVAGWRMLGQGSLVGIGSNLMTERSKGAGSEVIAVTPETLAGEAKAADRERETDRVAGADKAEETDAATRAGSAVAGRGGATGMTGTSGAEVRQPVPATLREHDEGMAAAGFKDKQETRRPPRRQVRAVEQPRPAAEAGKATSTPPTPPVTAGNEAPARFAQVERVEVTPELLSEPVLPDVADKDTGTAVLRLTTDSLGAVTRAVVMRSSGRALNDSVAVRNARASRFKPVLREGRRLGSVFQRQFRFRAAPKKSEDNVDKPEREPPKQDTPPQGESGQDKPQPGKPPRSRSNQSGE